MLVELRIHNLLLIESAHIELSGGLNAFTGETGAGKSLLVDALGFLLGARGDAGMVRAGAAQAEVSARFMIADATLAEAIGQDLGIVFDDQERGQGSGVNGRGEGLGVRGQNSDGGKGPAELVVSRTIPREGRARAHANGRPIALAALKELGERLVDIHGQHENQSLLRPQTRLEILDRYAGAVSERAALRRAHTDALAAARALVELRRAVRDRQGREDATRFNLKELDDARLDDLDPARLDDEMRLLKGAEKIRAAAQAAKAALDGDDGESAALLLARAVKGLASLHDSASEVADLAARMESLLAETREIAREAGDLSEKARSDPERLSDLEDSRDRLRRLERKHGRDLAGLRALHVRLRAELSDLQESDARSAEREAALESAVDALKAAARKLTSKRASGARQLEKLVNKELAGLGLKGAVLKIELTCWERTRPAPGPSVPSSSSEPLQNEDRDSNSENADDEAHQLLPPEIHASGAESMEILFSANPELSIRPLKECASGGEISRVMLALKGVLARTGGADRLPVVVFDEVDSGVGGRLGAVLGRKLAELARVRQVLCVTHQPQVAAFAERQMKVEKTRHGQHTTVSVEWVDGARRVDELALMLRGEAASDRTRAEAQAMLKEARGSASIHTK